MVSTGINGVSPQAEAPSAPSVEAVAAERPVGLPPGKYALVAWDMDTTGTRLIDEICQIAAYTPTSQFSQYIMPHKNLNPVARRRHNIRVVTVGRYRILKDNRTNKVLKTKSEVSALTDFLDWLEKEKANAPDGVILIYHEAKKVHPAMLLEALDKYNLLDRFKSLVAGFADGHWLAAEKCRSSVKSLSLRSLSRVLLDDSAGTPAGNNTMLGEGDASERALAAYRVAEHLATGDRAALPSSTGAAAGDAAVEADRVTVVDAVRSAARPLAKETDALVALKQLLERQNTFRPIFLPMLRASWTERVRAAFLRRALAQANFSYADLQAVWKESQSSGLENELSSLKLSEEQQKELIEILDCHFDPEKEAKGAKIGPRGRYQKNYQNRNSKNRNRQAGDQSGGEGGQAGDGSGSGDANDGGDGGEESASPDTVSSAGSPVKNNRSDAGVVTSSVNNSSHSETAVVN